MTRCGPRAARPRPWRCSSRQRSCARTAASATSRPASARAGRRAAWSPITAYSGTRCAGSQDFTYPFPRGALCIAHSDGLSARWDLAAYPGLEQRHPSLVAAVLFRDHGRERDDATVAVVRNEDTVPVSIRIMTVALRQEQDVVGARQRARQISGLLGFEGQDQVRIATAVSEIARNAFRYARRRRGRVRDRGRALAAGAHDTGDGLGPGNHRPRGASSPGATAPRRAWGWASSARSA